MKTSAAAIALAAFSILLVGAVIGCGGGGGNPIPIPPTPTQLYSGSYHYTALWGNYTVPSVAAWWGDYTVDGAGMITGGTLSVNNNGAPIATAPVTPFPYTVDASHRVVWSPGVPAEHTGGLAADGRAAVLASSYAAGTPLPTLALSLRRAGTFTAGSLVGTYHVAATWRAGASVGSIWGTANFDGISAVTWTVDQNINGVITSPAPFPASTYSVAVDGSVDLSLGSAALSGGMLEGGEFVAVAGTNLPASPQLMMVLTRQASSASAATFSGPYHLAFLNLSDSGPPHYTSLTGPMTADGAGMLNIPAGSIANVDGAITPTASDSNGPYAILPNGHFTISGLQGAISQSGAFAFLGGRTTAGSDPALWIMIR